MDKMKKKMLKRNEPKAQGKMMRVEINVSKTEKKSANKINQEENKQMENNGKKQPLKETQGNACVSITKEVKSGFNAGKLKEANGATFSVRDIV